MNAFVAIVLASIVSRLGYQMARSPVLPAFAADLGALPEMIGLIVAASTITGAFVKLPAGALSDVLGKKRMMVLGALFFAVPPFFYPLVTGRATGTGLGLTIAQDLVSRNGGLIEFTSEPGRTVFQIRLPVVNGAR